MIDKSNPAFAPKTPSVFVIATPLQCLCALEAIREFEIEDYKIVFPYEQDKIRYRQVENMLDIYNLVYEKQKVIVSNVYVGKMYLASLFSTKNKKFKRIFIGDNFNLLFLSIALKYLKLGGYVVYLDDGTKTLSYLRCESVVTTMQRVRNLFNCFMYSIRLSMVNKYFFTLYHDIETKKIVYPNSFVNLGKSMEIKRNKNRVYFIGTVPKGYSFENLCGEEDVYRKNIYKILLAVKDKSQVPIVYIPHGRDDSDYTPKFCEELGIEYIRLEEAVESYLIKSEFYPSVVYGFMSSALFNLRKMFNNAQIINICMTYKKSVRYNRAIAMSDYYAKHGIDNRFILFD